MSSVPWYLWALVLVGLGLILLVAARQLWAAARAAGVAGGPAWRASALFTAGYLGWIAVTAAVGGGNVYRLDSTATKPWLGLGFAVPVVGLLLLTRLPFAGRALADPEILVRLIRPHQVRVVGVTFLISLALGELPAAFALPAGLGDIAIGLAAPWVARGLRDGDGVRRAVWFNILGLVDFVVAFAIGFLGGPAPSQLVHLTPNTQLISTLPLVLVPTAAVPLLCTLHLVSLAKLRARIPAAPPAAQPTPAVN